MLLKKRDLNLSECEQLFKLISDQRVFPYVRERATTFTNYLFNTKRLLEKEKRRELFTRTILNELGKPIGCISLFDVLHNEGFLATWIGSDYHGQGYNQPAKEAFLDHIFFIEGVENVFMKIRKSNVRSLKAARKLPYASIVNESREDIYQLINKNEEIFDLFCISKLSYFKYKQEEDIEEAIMA